MAQNWETLHEAEVLDGLQAAKNKTQQVRVQHSKLNETFGLLLHLQRQLSELHTLIDQLGQERYNLGVSDTEEIWQEKAKEEYERGYANGLARRTAQERLDEDAAYQRGKAAGIVETEEKQLDEEEAAYERGKRDGIIEANEVHLAQAEKRPERG